MGGPGSGRKPLPPHIKNAHARSACEMHGYVKPKDRPKAPTHKLAELQERTKAHSINPEDNGSTELEW
jgi:hypothetical protein